jgi:hypothetical protein
MKSVPPRKAASPELNLSKFACLFLSANMSDFSRAATRRDGVAELVLLSLLPLSVLPAGLFPNFRTENHAV